MTSFAELHPAIELCQPTTLNPYSVRNCVIRHGEFKRMLSTSPEKDDEVLQHCGDDA